MSLFPGSDWTNARLVEECLDQADLQRRHEDNLWLPLAREEICAGHHASLLRTVRNPRLGGTYPTVAQENRRPQAAERARRPSMAALLGLVLACLAVDPRLVHGAGFRAGHSRAAVVASLQPAPE